MRSHVGKTVSSCFTILSNLDSICRSVLRTVLASMVVSLVLPQLDFGNTTLTGISVYLLQWLQLVMNAAARLIFSSLRFKHISPLLRTSRSLSGSIIRSFWQKNVKMVWRQRTYVTNYIDQHTLARRRLRSASSMSLDVRHTRLSTVGDRAFPVAAVHLCHVEQSSITCRCCPPSLHPLLSS